MLPVTPSPYYIKKAPFIDVGAMSCQKQGRWDSNPRLSALEAVALGRLTTPR